MQTLKRVYKPGWTEGTLILPNGEGLVTLEKPWRDNKPNRSCIPEGIYIITRNTTGKHQFYGVNDVPNRTHIEIHPAYRQRDLLGCIAPGLSINQGRLSESRKACEILLDWFGDHSWVLEITS